MSFFAHFFDSADRKKRLAHIKALMELAAVDGNVDDNEIDKISVDERLILLADYIQVMYADGVIDPKELTYCYQTVVKLRFPEEKAESLIKLFSRAIEHNLDSIAVLAEAKALLA